MGQATQAATWRDQGVVALPRRLGGWWAPWPSFGHLEASGMLIFYIFSWNFWSTINMVKTCNSQTSVDKNWHWGALSY